jgi:hypothetical protein
MINYDSNLSYMVGKFYLVDVGYAVRLGFLLSYRGRKGVRCQEVSECKGTVQSKAFLTEGNS